MKILVKEDIESMRIKMSKENFVNIVGYQFERIHNGVIKWILDWKNKSINEDYKYEIIKRIYFESNNNIDFTKEDIADIVCKTEYPFGRQLRIDLLIIIKLKNGEERFLILETKVDSIPEEYQLKRIYQIFNEKHNKNNPIFLLFLFGTSNVCEKPQNLHSFAVIDIDKIIRIFDINKKINSNIFNNWLQELKEEKNRMNNIEYYLKNSHSFLDEDYWNDKGYRTWLPLYYCIYNKMRDKSKKSDKWLIYSGNNNAVMNWKEWIAGDKLSNNDISQLLGERKKDVEFYFEFNNNLFYLKMHLRKANSLSTSEIEAIKTQIEKIWNNQNIKKGKKASRARGGEWISLYRVDFDFKNDDLSHIINEAEKIIEEMSKRL